MSTATSAPDLHEQLRLAPLAFVAARIKEARIAAKLSHDALGERLGGVTRQHLIKLEKAKHRPRLETLTRIAEVTGRDVSWFLAPEVDQDPIPFPGKAA